MFAKNYMKLKKLDREAHVPSTRLDPPLDLHRQIFEAALSPPNVLHFMHFSRNCGRIIGWRPMKGILNQSLGKTVRVPGVWWSLQFYCHVGWRAVSAYQS